MARQRRRGVDADAGALAHGVNRAQQAVGVLRRLDVEVDDVAARLGERLELALGLLDHQVDVERERRRAAHRFDDERAEGDRRDEAAVHHVEVDVVSAALLGRPDLLREAAEVGGEDRRRELDGGHVFSSHRCGVVAGAHRIDALARAAQGGRHLARRRPADDVARAHGRCDVDTHGVSIEQRREAPELVERQAREVHVLVFGISHELARRPRAPRGTAIPCGPGSRRSRWPASSSRPQPCARASRRPRCAGSIAASTSSVGSSVSSASKTARLSSCRSRL